MHLFVRLFLYRTRFSVNHKTIQQKIRFLRQYTTTLINLGQIYLERTWRRSRLVSRSWLTSCREALVVSWWKSLPPRMYCRYPAFPVAGLRPTGCQLDSSCQGCSRPPAAQAQRPAVLVRNSRGRRRNQRGSRRPRDLCHVHDFRGPRQCHCLREFTMWSDFDTLT